MRFRFEPLGDHDRVSFSCGHENIDRFLNLKTTAGQHQDRRIAKTMIAVDADGDPRQIIGFYTVIPHEFRGDELPDPFRKATRAGSLSAVPGALLAQLAVSLPLQGQGVGKVLVKHALSRIAGLAADWGCAAVVTDPIDDRARSLYRGFDFEPLHEGSNRMIVATKTIIAAIERAGARADFQ